MTKTRPLKNPHWDPSLDLFDEPGVPPVYLGPDQGIHPVPPVPLYHLDELDFFLFDDGIELPCYPYDLHLDPGAEGLKEDDWLRCEPGP